MRSQFRLILYTIVLLVLNLFLVHNIILAQINRPSVWPDRIVLNPTPDPLTSIAVTWRTDTTVKVGFCQIQPVSSTRINSDNTRLIKAATKTCKFVYENELEINASQHSILLNGLSPGKSYMYRVGNEDHWSEWFEFKTPSANQEEFSFIYFGDPQINLKSEWSRVVRKAYQMSPDCMFMLYGGDIINRAGRDIEWYEWFEAGSYLFSSVPQVMTPGNHDYNDLIPGLHWNTQFTQPTNGPAGLDGTCFFIDYPNLKLISIDSATDCELEDESGYEMTAQKAWLDSVLRTNTKRWVVVATHLPFYSTKDTRDNPQLRRHFQPILEKYKVDLVLTGHDHSYGRGRASDNPSINPSIVYVLSVSGPKLYPTGTKTWMEKSGGYIQLFQKITISGNILEFNSFTASGDLFDAFRIERRKSGKKKFFEMRPE